MLYYCYNFASAKSKVKFSDWGKQWTSGRENQDESTSHLPLSDAVAVLFFNKDYKSLISIKPPN